jgi:hypothetical protein
MTDIQFIWFVVVMSWANILLSLIWHELGQINKNTRSEK